MSIAMELEKPKETKPNILAEITCIKEPFDAHYLTKNTILINGRHKCSIVNPAKNEEIKRIFDHDCWGSSIAVHPNKTKFALAAYHYPTPNSAINDARQKIIIYNAQTYAIEHAMDWDNYATVGSMRFSPLSDLLAICEYGGVNVILYNYTTHTTTTIKVPEAAREHLEGYDNHSPIFAFHPTQPLILLAWQTVYVHDLTTSTQKKVANAPNYLEWCEYIPNGSSIVAGTHKKISIMKPRNVPHFTVTLDWNTTESFSGMAIHPNNKIIAILKKQYNNYILDYWNINKRQWVAGDKIVLEGYYPSLSFSPCGTVLLLIMKNMLVQLEVPFNVIYKNNTKEIFPYLLFLINNLNSQSNGEIPQEVNRLLATTLLETYKQ
jgi:WD40 repeat protein